MAELHDLERAARRAYELGRLRSSLWVVPVVVGLWILSWFCCGPDSAIFVAGPLLLLSSVGLLWKGMIWAKAVIPGLAAGAFVFACPVVAEALSCSWLQCVIACGAAGFIGSIVLVAVAAFLRMMSLPFLVASVSLTWLCGSLGCAVISWTGLLALAAGLLFAMALVTPWLARQLKSPGGP